MDGMLCYAEHIWYDPSTRTPALPRPFWTIMGVSSAALVDVLRAPTGMLLSKRQTVPLRQLENNANSLISNAAIDVVRLPR